MALPGSSMWTARRGGFARRESNLALLGALLTGALIAFGVLLLLVERVNPDQGARLRGATLDAVAPLWRLVTAPIDGLNAAGARVAAHWNTVDKLRAAEARNIALERQLAAQAALRADVKRLEGLLAARRTARRLVASADVSAAAAGTASRTAVLAAGLNQGVRPGMPVIAADGIAGRIIEVGRASARLLLLTDSNSRVPARVVRTGWTGMAIGTGGALLDFAFDNPSATDALKVGDRLVTSGDGGLFPPDVPVGVVVDVRTSPPRIRPAANPHGLGMVSVEAPWMPPPVVVPAGVAPFEPDVAAIAPPAPATAPAVPGAVTGSPTPAVPTVVARP